MQFGALLMDFGISMAVSGFLLEIVAMIGVASYRIRRTLPVASPIGLQSLGGLLFCAGAACAWIGGCLSR